MILTTQLLIWTLLVAVQRGAGSHPGVTRVLPVEGGLADFRIGPAASPPPPPSTPPTPPPAPPTAPPPPPTPAVVREEYAAPESSVRFPNNLDVNFGNPFIRGNPSFPAWTNSAQRHIPHQAFHGIGTGTETGPAGVQTDHAVDNSASASGNAYLPGGEYLEEDGRPPGLIGGQTDSEVTFRYEHHPSIFVKNPSFNSVAIGFIVYLILLTVLQNSMLNWSQKGALLTLGATTQRNQDEAIARAKPISHTRVSTTSPSTRDVDHRARIQPEAEATITENKDRERFPVSVAAILNGGQNSAAADINIAAATGKSRTASPRAASQENDEHSVTKHWS